MKKFKKGVSKKLYKSTAGNYITITVEELNEFIQNGADPNYISEPDNYGQSYSIIENCSVKDEHNPQLKCLIEHGADPAIEDGFGTTALEHALGRGGRFSNSGGGDVHLETAAFLQSLMDMDQ